MHGLTTIAKLNAQAREAAAIMEEHGFATTAAALRRDAERGNDKPEAPKPEPLAA